MKYAIDRYSIGAETEVSANDFDGQYIPARKNRFYCPECGEIVYFRSSGGSHPCQFYHQEKKDKTPECDRRVDGRSNLSLNQRVGLPLYLTRMLSGQFHLNIGFPALGAEMLRKAASLGYSVEITYGKHLQTVKINQTNFIEDSLTLIPVSFLPANGKNYSITISGESNVFGLRRRWADYADGFELDGAIFTYDEIGGKKIRRGDSISTHRSYYAVIRNALPSYPEIIQHEEGSIRIGSSTYRVIKIEIMVSVENKSVFSAIGKYFYKHFGVWLLERQPELVPLWPPVVQDVVYSPILPKTNVICGVVSSNAEPNIYVYSDYGVNQKKACQTSTGIWTVEVPVGKRPVTLSVDRKYVGREVTFLYKKETKRSNVTYDVYITDHDGKTVDWKDVDTEILSKDFSIISSSKMELYTGTRDRSFRHISIRKTITAIPARMNTNELYLLNGEGIIRHIFPIPILKALIDIDEFADTIRNVRKDRMVPIPLWADAMIRRFKREHFQTMYESIISTIENGNVPIDVLKQLRIIELKNRGLFDYQSNREDVDHDITR